MQTFARSVIDFNDPKACRTVIDALPLADAQRLRESLTVLISGMQRAKMDAIQQLGLLERLQTPLALAQGNASARYSQRPCAPGTPEDAVLRHSVALWRAMANSYSLVAQRANGALGDRKLAQVCQRCVQYSAKALFEYYLARREIPRGLWLELHGYFETSEEWHLSEVPIEDPATSIAQSAAQAFAGALLIDLANPYGRNARELQVIAEWAEHFSRFVEVINVFEGPESLVFGIDLRLDSGPRPLAVMTHTSSLRRLATTRLAAELERVVSGLRTGRSTREMQLPSEGPPLASARLLAQLFKPWCQAAVQRRFPRRPVRGQLVVGRSFSAIHQLGASHGPPPPEMPTIYRYRGAERFLKEDLPTDHMSSGRMVQREFWDVLDQSANGYRLRLEEVGSAMDPHELLGLCSGNDLIQLARIRWLMFESGGALQLGLQVMAGIAEPCWLRVPGQAEELIRAFVLPEVSSMREETSLVVPRGTFQVERQLILYQTRSQHRIRLLAMLTYGTNFERVSFQRLS